MGLEVGTSHLGNAQWNTTLPIKDCFSLKDYFLHGQRKLLLVFYPQVLKIFFGSLKSRKYCSCIFTTVTELNYVVNYIQRFSSCDLWSLLNKRWIHKIKGRVGIIEVVTESRNVLRYMLMCYYTILHVRDVFKSWLGKLPNTGLYICLVDSTREAVRLLFLGHSPKMGVWGKPRWQGRFSVFH